MEKKTIKLVTVSNNTIDAFLWDMRTRCADKGNLSYSECLQCVSPLDWYIGTGRAPYEFLEKLLGTTNRQKTTIAKWLIANCRGNYDAVIAKICKYIGFDRD